MTLNPRPQPCVAPLRRRANSLLGRMTSLPRAEKFPAPRGPGNWLQAVESTWRRTLKTAPTSRSRANFPKTPYQIPCRRESGAAWTTSPRSATAVIQGRKGRRLDRTGIDAQTFLARAVRLPERLAGFDSPAICRAWQQPLAALSAVLCPDGGRAPPHGRNGVHHRPRNRSGLHG